MAVAVAVAATVVESVPAQAHAGEAEPEHANADPVYSEAA